jgi:RHS repeat-associated protein
MNRGLSLLLRGAGVWVLAISIAAAQTKDPPTGIAVKIWATGYANDYAAETTISGYFLSPPPAVGNVYSEASVSTDSGSDMTVSLGDSGYVRVEPGKAYTVSVSGSSIGGIDANIVAPPGYRVVMDNFYRTRESFADCNSATIVFQLLPLGERHPGLAGLASSISSLSIDWRVSLGSLLNGASAGDLSLIDTGVRSDWSLLTTPSSLYYEPVSAEVSVYRPGDAVRQIVANQVAVDVVRVATGTEIRCYNPRQKFGNSAPYGFTGQPFVTYRIEQGGTATSLKITKEVINVVDPNATNLPVARREVMSLSRTGAWPNISWTKTDWTLENQTPVTEVDVVSTGSASNRTESISVKSPGGAVATALTRSYTVPVDGSGQSTIGEALSSEILGSANGLPVGFTYYTDATQWGSLGYVKSATLPGGKWMAYDYYDGDPMSGTPSGRIKYRYQPYLNAPASASFSPSSGAVTYYEYVADVFGAQTLPSLIKTTVNGVSTAQSTIAYNYYSSVYYSGTEAVRTDYSSSGQTVVTKIRSFRDDVPNGFVRGQLYSTIGPDNTQQSFGYQLGNWNGTTFSGGSGIGYGNASRITVITGSANASAGRAYGSSSDSGYYVFDGLYLVEGKSTKEVTIRDNRALVVRSESYGWKTNAWVLMAWTNYTYDMAGRLTQRVNSNGTTYTASYDGGLKTSDTDEAGVTTTYTYDAGGRVLTSTRVGTGAIPSATTKYTYDAASHALRTDVGYGQPEVITSQAQYDDAGRIVLETPPGNYGAASHSYDVANRTHTVTNADGATVTTTANLDGSAASTTGTATVPTYHSYGVEADGRQWHQVNSGTANSPRWQKSWADWLGRTLETDSPGFTGQPTIVATNFYENGTGRLIKTTKTGYAPTLYQYNALGQVNRSGLDYDNNGLLVLASSDRITETDTYFENYNNAWWARTDTRTYPKLGVNTVIVTSTSRSRLTGFPANRISEAQAIDAEGNLTTKVVDVNRAAATAVATTTQTGIAGAMTENTVGGVSVSVTGFDGLTTSKAYDALLRSLSVSDSRGNTVTSAYIPGTSMIQTVTDAAGDVSTTGYDAVGRVSWQRDPKNFYSRFAYNLRGQTVHQWGDGTMPVEYGYDPTYGDKITMSTFRAGTGWEGAAWPTNPGAADTTTWTYDGPSGLLTSKRDAPTPEHPNGCVVSQTYNLRGQTAARTLARGATTTYGYDGATGELLTQTYSDSTPAVTFTYGRTGQVESVTDYTGFRDLVYDANRPWRLSAEAESDFYGNRVVTRNYDETGVIGRVNGLQLGSGVGSNADLEQKFGFTTVGRFDTITSNRTGNSATSHVFRYGYLSNAALLQNVGLDGTGFTISRTYEAHRDLITSINGQWSTASRSRYDYTYDERGQRTSSVQSGDAFSDYGDATFHLFTYDGRGEVTGDVGYLGSTPTDQSRPLPGRHYGFGYDNAGNRKWSDRTGVDADNDGLPDLRDNYTTNALNQYVSRENNTVPISGTASSDTTPAGGQGGTAVNVKGRTVAAGRQGRYWNDEITVANTLNPWRGPVTIFSAKRGTAGSPDLYRVDSRMVEVASVLQGFTYDEDGNLTSDGLVDYTWDAENRLVRMETSANALTYGFPHRLLEFKYDYLGRRVQKRVVDVDQNVELSNRRYLYDGWNVIAEYAVVAGPASLVLLRSYTWGLDIALSMTNAGGVGALLQIADHPTGKTYLPTYDGNGNVVTLLNGDSGAVAAVYEYSPFGEPLRAQTYDPTIADNPFRFSTKWTDLETGLVYYGHRYYSASLGRFINRDPIQESGGLNLYHFCGNNPVNRWDVLGNVDVTNAPLVCRQPSAETAGVAVVASTPILPSNTNNNYDGYGGADEGEIGDQLMAGGLEFLSSLQAAQAADLGAALDAVAADAVAAVATTASATTAAVVSSPTRAPQINIGDLSLIGSNQLSPAQVANNLAAAGGASKNGQTPVNATNSNGDALTSVSTTASAGVTVDAGAAAIVGSGSLSIGDITGASGATTAPDSVISFYSPQSDSWNAIAPGGLSTPTIYDRNAQQLADMAQFNQMMGDIGGDSLKCLAIGAAGAAIGAGIAIAVPVIAGGVQATASYLAMGGAGTALPGAGYVITAGGTGFYAGATTVESAAAATGILATRTVIIATTVVAPILSRPELVQGVADFVDTTWGAPMPAFSTGGLVSTGYQGVKFVTPGTDNWP